MAGKKKTNVDVIGAAMKLAGVQGWRDTTMADIAETAGLSLVELRNMYGSKTAILAGLIRQTDDIVLAGSGADMADEPVRDRLFDVIMRRLDALAPYRDGIAAVARDLTRDPGALACLAAGPGRRSLQWMLEAARIQPWGLAAPLQIKGLGLVYASVLRVWLTDEGEDLSKTMAALDKALGRVESILSTLRRGPRRFRRDDNDTAETTTE
ncbi:MAG: TetR family transcriptional regulator [Rhodospirillaceae bacterium]|jgi:AcrR family transcriptional regulator|nr:TetR family transcriptional regulator [Rhodospirillaceae bacterium]MBT4690124.1 TetR family transcriptional regulator [Rhodospirillaceae bacterium]MBT5080689.1 TetR family transcriptional regulator [Rhodospirillaceae bacterium]MBT5524217.1 TetR family transcriptional regulator [Rhodospirillaceae bacterium]MBT5881262.1 TetR family transcriptional regulator [Rhodospirillaceae bacterium]